MVFTGISKDFLLTNERQYETIGRFWDEMELKYGLENLQGLGYRWDGCIISYAIGLKNGRIEGSNLSIPLPDDGWEKVTGKTVNLKQMYDEIYKYGPLQYEIETFYEDGKCEILYRRT
ncbi:MAG: hypothetical protein IJC48_09515 [Clostridia bacterium]|nr:hypothetical protein [Clostridia bacterium]